jgi:hypothetical protein
MQTSTDDPRVKLMQKWSQNMPAYGAQGTGLRAEAKGGDYDDDDDDSRSTRSAFSTASNMSSRSKSFISIKPSKKYFQRVRAEPTATASHGTQGATPVQNTQASSTSQGPEQGKRRKGKRNNRAKKFVPNEFDILVLETHGWVPIRVTKETAVKKINQATKNLVKKNIALWADITKAETMTLFDNVYNAQSSVITAIAANLNGGYPNYDHAIEELVKFQIELKSKVREKYQKEAMALPYNTNMEKYVTLEDYITKMENLKLDRIQFIAYNLAKLIQYFVKSLASYTADKYGKIPEEKIKEAKSKDKKINRENILRELSPGYETANEMIDIISPWIQAIPRCVQLINSKPKGAHAAQTSHLRYTGKNKYAGIEPPDE